MGASRRIFIARLLAFYKFNSCVNGIKLIKEEDANDLYAAASAERKAKTADAVLRLRDYENELGVALDEAIQKVDDGAAIVERSELALKEAKVKRKEIAKEVKRTETSKESLQIGNKGWIPAGREKAGEMAEQDAKDTLEEFANWKLDALTLTSRDKKLAILSATQSIRQQIESLERREIQLRANCEVSNTEAFSRRIHSDRMKKSAPFSAVPEAGLQKALKLKDEGEQLQLKGEKECAEAERLREVIEDLEDKAIEKAEKSEEEFEGGMP